MKRAERGRDASIANGFLREMKMGPNNLGVLK
jgi:hypothetical protein